MTYLSSIKTWIFQATIGLTLAATLNAQHADPSNSPTAANSDAELAIKKFQPATGLKVELFAAEPQLLNPVAFSVDGQGRFYIAETHRYGISVFDITQNMSWLLDDLSFRTFNERHDFLTRTFATNETLLTQDSEIVRLVEDRNGDGQADASRVFADGFNEVTSGTAAGVLAHGTNVWFGNIPTLWHLTSTNDQTTKHALATGFGVHIGVTGHDLHGLILGPDGRLYLSVGDRGFTITNREGAVLNFPDTGGVLRCEPDGSKLEVFAYGLRNPQELAFDDYGNLWTVDNDTAGADPCRVIHVVEGGDYGWRCSYQHQEGFGPWVLEGVWAGDIDDVLPNAGVVSQGPSGLAWYPGTGFGERLRGKFLHCDFPGGVWSFSVEPRGASFAVTTKEKFLWSLWPTDVDFGPDGYAYVADWVGGWGVPNKGRLYRISDPTQIHAPEVAEVKQLLAEGMAQRPQKELLMLLSHKDRRVRQEAQFVLAQQLDAASSQPLEKVALSDKNQLARLHALWAIGQIGRRSPADSMTKRLNALTPLLTDKDSIVRGQALRVLSELNAPGVAKTLAKFSEDSPALLYAAGMAWANLPPAATTPKPSRIPDARQAFLERAAASPDAYVRHAAVLLLTRHTTTSRELLAFATNHTSPAVRQLVVLAQRRLGSEGIAHFLNDADDSVALTAARAINDAPVNAALPALAAKLDQPWPDLPRTVTTNEPPRSPLEQFLIRSLNANFRLGTAAEASRLAKFALNSDAPEAMRVESLNALGDWAKPYPLDRVMGLWRPLPDRDGRIARSALEPVLTKLLGESSESVLVAAIRSAANLEAKSIAARLLELMRATQNVPVRKEILFALEKWHEPQLGEAVQFALSDRNTELRREGVRLLSKTKVASAAQALETLLTTETDISLNQSALAALGNLPGGEADALLQRWLQKLVAGEVKPELQLDVLLAAEKHPTPAIQKLLQEHKAKQPADDLTADYREVLAGGNAANGKKIFYERADVSCLRCHAIKKEGGIVGPPLDGIATKKSRPYLLEAILDPNRTIAAGYENLIITRKDGSFVAGTLKGMNETSFIIDSPEDGEVTIPRKDVAARKRGLSAMPEGLAQMLTKQELRDLMEFLGNLK